MTAGNPAGPWSDPYYLQGADGIDPSLFFDEDGKCYYIGTHPNPDGCRYDGDYFIWIQELDIRQMKLVGEVHNVWNGAMRGVHWPEGPHLYKKDGYYYILHAEGGTGPEHAVTVCRSREIYGPYENNFCNPILTHRHLGQAYPVRYVGHGDMVEAANGEWYMVMLAVRPLEGYTTMGRETFLARVVWENGWPVVNPGVGVLTEEVEIHLPEWNPGEDAAFDTAANCVPGSSRTYDFTAMERLGDEFLALRNPGEDMYALDREGLKLSFRSVPLKEKGSPSYLCVRQQHHAFRASAVFGAENLTEGRRAGMALVQSNDFHLRVEVSRAGTGIGAEVILCSEGRDRTVGKHLIRAEEGEDILLDEVQVTLKVEGLTASVELGYSRMLRATEECCPGTALLCGGIDIRGLSTEAAGGFVGCTAGMYAVADQDAGGQSARFRSFSYIAQEER